MGFSHAPMDHTVNSGLQLQPKAQVVNYVGSLDLVRLIDFPVRPTMLDCDSQLNGRKEEFIACCGFPIDGKCKYWPFSYLLVVKPMLMSVTVNTKQ